MNGCWRQRLDFVEKNWRDTSRALQGGPGIEWPMSLVMVQSCVEFGGRSKEATRTVLPETRR